MSSLVLVNVNECECERLDKEINKVIGKNNFDSTHTYNFKKRRKRSKIHLENVIDEKCNNSRELKEEVVYEAKVDDSRIVELSRNHHNNVENDNKSKQIGIRIGNDYQAELPDLGTKASSHNDRYQVGNSEIDADDNNDQGISIHRGLFLIGIHLFGKNFELIAALQLQVLKTLGKETETQLTDIIEKNKLKKMVIEFYYMSFKQTREYMVWKILKNDKQYSRESFLNGFGRETKFMKIIGEQKFL